MNRELSWTLNENEGRYARTNIVAKEVVFRLSLRRSSGSLESVGTFALNLDDLASRGVATKRTATRGHVFDVQIYRDQNGIYSVGVRRDHTVPLASFAHP